MVEINNNSDNPYNKAKSDFLKKIILHKDLNPLKLLEDTLHKDKIFEELLNSRTDLILRAYVEPLGYFQTFLSWFGFKPSIKYDFSKQDSEGITVFDYLRSSKDMLETFFNKSKEYNFDLDLNLRMQDGLPLLLHAAKNKKFNLLEVLVNHEADVSITDDKNENILHKLTNSYDEDDSKDKHKNIMHIFRLINDKNPELFNTLWKQHNIDDKMPKNNIEDQSSTIVVDTTILITNNLINTHLESGLNPIHALLNLKENAGKILEYFLENKPDLIFKEYKNDKAGRNSKDIAEIYNPNQLDETKFSLLEHFIGSDEMLKVIFNTFGKTNVDPNIRSGDGSTPIMRAAEYGFIKSLKYLNNNHQIDWKIKTNKSQNIMHRIAIAFKERDKEGQLEAIKILNKKGLLWEQLNLKDKNGKEPHEYLLDISKTEIDPNKIDLVDKLKELEPRFQDKIPTNQGKNPPINPRDKGIYTEKVKKEREISEEKQTSLNIKTKNT